MEFFFTKTAAEQLASLPKSDQKRIAQKMRFYASQRNPLKFAKPLTGHSAYRFRIGKYRIIFDTKQNTLVILIIMPRDGVYKSL